MRRYEQELLVLNEQSARLRIWIDADACPKAAKDMVVKFALKRSFEVLLVAGQVQGRPAHGPPARF